MSALTSVDRNQGDLRATGEKNLGDVTYWWFPLTWYLSSCSRMKPSSCSVCPPPAPTAEETPLHVWSDKTQWSGQTGVSTFHCPFSLAFLMTLFIISVGLRRKRSNQQQGFNSRIFLQLQGSRSWLIMEVLIESCVHTNISFRVSMSNPINTSGCLTEAKALTVIVGMRVKGSLVKTL